MNWWYSYKNALLILNYIFFILRYHWSMQCKFLQHLHLSKSSTFHFIYVFYFIILTTTTCTWCKLASCSCGLELEFRRSHNELSSWTVEADQEDTWTDNIPWPYLTAHWRYLFHCRISTSAGTHNLQRLQLRWYSNGKLCAHPSQYQVDSTGYKSCH